MGNLGKEYTGEPMTATDKLQRDVSKTTNAAISEGKKDVDQVKAVVAGVSRFFILPPTARPGGRAFGLIYKFFFINRSQ
jgi:hypothetical protein